MDKPKQIKPVAQHGEDSDEPLLIVRDLRKFFPITGGLLNRKIAEVQAVDEISFEVKRNETLGIVGESGCGKSTTARLLIRLIEPDSGEVLFDGQPVAAPGGISVRAMRRQVQMVFQDSYSSLNPRLPIIDTIAYGPKVHGLSRDAARDRARTLLQQVGLEAERFGRRYPHELSGGQRQRINIARALALRPQLLLLDEAVSALDKSVEAQVLNLLLDLKRELDLTFIFISHDLNVVQFISDRVLVMYLGKVVEIGPVDAIYGAPAHPYTRALLSSRPSMDPEDRISEPPLSGDPPNPINPPSGCRFRTRCAFAEDVCKRVEPQLADLAGHDRHRVACHMALNGSGHSAAAANVSAPAN
ncbi:MAG: ATP-binding cassette domain-containing protein [Alphaproteobacteria bacterium]|nr:ATP-binding cassette domain-containing protein [Alphaproteobacteria bacterium]